MKLNSMTPAKIKKILPKPSAYTEHECDQKSERAADEPEDLQLDAAEPVGEDDRKRDADQ